MIVQRDINSAYPWACTKLPCLTCGTWKRTRTPTPGAFYVGKYTFTHPGELSLCHLPIRSRQGSISFPRTGTGWYWSPESEAATRAGSRITLHGYAMEYDRRCEHRLFDFIPPLYAERKRLGKSGRGMVLKLGLNSLYGKLAQSVGAAPWANPIYAGLITSLVRARLIDDYTRVGNDKCVMLATDGVFYQLDAPDGYDTGTELGQWEEKIHDDGCFIIQPGLYFVSSEMGEPKTRGVPQRAVARMFTNFSDAWLREMSVPVPVHTFTGLRLAAARNKLDTAGQWVDGYKDVAFDWRTKRVKDRLYYDRGWKTLPIEGGATTVPYGKMIGKIVTDLEGINEQEDGPDYAGPDHTPDPN